MHREKLQLSVILSSMEVLSHYDAVGKVMAQLASGVSQRVVGPGDPKTVLSEGPGMALSRAIGR